MGFAVSVAMDGMIGGINPVGFCDSYRGGKSRKMNDKLLADCLPRFREMAAEAQQASERVASTEMKLAYEELAEAWKQLLREIEES